MADDEALTPGEEMAKELYLAPAFHLEKSKLQEALEQEIDETAERAKRASRPRTPEPKD